MRRKLQPDPPKPKPGDIRRCTWFAWTPVTVGLEWRWLERVTVEEVCKYRRKPHVGEIPYWVATKFVDDDSTKD